MAGAGYKLFNTGDVLTAAQVNTYLMEQTVMVFADAAARTTALTGVVSEGMISYLKDTNAVEVYNGSAWVSSDDPNAIQNTIVDAKGDLITATASDVPARLAVGNNGETLVADSSATTGLRWTATPSASNPILNSAFQIWQRGTSIATGAAQTYGPDRWQTYRSGNVAGSTVSRQVTGDTTNLPEIQYCARVQRDSGNTSTAFIQMAQSLETINSIPFAGKTITLSFYARKGADFSSASSNLQYRLNYGTGTDQNINGTYTGSVSLISNNATLTSDWQRFTATATIASTATEIAVRFQFTPVGTAGAADYFEVTGVQLDIGSVALPFRTYSATLAGEYAAAQRYYYRATSDGTTATMLSTLGVASSTTAVSFGFRLPATMRVKPSAVDFANLAVLDVTASRTNATTVTLTDSGVDHGAVSVSGASGLTSNRPYYLYNQSGTTGYIGFSAEL